MEKGIGKQILEIGGNSRKEVNQDTPGDRGEKWKSQGSIKSLDKSGDPLTNKGEYKRDPHNIPKSDK